MALDPVLRMLGSETGYTLFMTPISYRSCINKDILWESVIRAFLFEYRMIL